MIRLSLPPYDPTKPLNFRATCTTQGQDFYLRFTPFRLRVHPDTFVGDAYIPFDEIGLGFADVNQRVPFEATLTLQTPEVYGLTGAEGWFDLAPELDRWIFIHDLVVYYTPRDHQDDGRAAGFFS